MVARDLPRRNQRSHLEYYLDEFTFRFNRRTSKARGLLFYRLLQQAALVDAIPYRHIRGATTTCSTEES
jgi:hypothetical protein